MPKSTKEQTDKLIKEARKLPPLQWKAYTAERRNRNPLILNHLEQGKIPLCLTRSGVKYWAHPWQAGMLVDKFVTARTETELAILEYFEYAFGLKEIPKIEKKEEVKDGSKKAS